MSAASPAATRMQWLGWDGRVLRWRIGAPSGSSTELRLDGIAFRRFSAADGDDTQPLACEFEYSPSGCDELEFSVAVAGAVAATGTPWRVRLGAATQPGTDAWTQASRYLRPLAGTPRQPQRAWSQLPDVAIVVPIFNAAHSVQRCLAAIERWTAPSIRLILIDDASTDAAIGALLAPLAQRDRVRIARHGTNRGYTHSVNTGLQLAGDADVILLNSDTEVGPRWLQSLRLAAYSDAAIGTVTAVSDNAGAFSVPELEQYCPPPARWDLPTAQRAVLQQAGLRFPELPTGNGFCMFVKHDVIARIGTLDAQAFPSGYGEENDFCQRAVLAGYRNVIAGNVLVRHERSASFGDARRTALGAQGMAVLRRRYPGYEAAIGATLYSFARRVLDYRVRRTYAGTDGRHAASAPRARVLVAEADAAAARATLATAGTAAELWVLRQTDRWSLCRAGSGGDAVVEAEVAADDGAAASRHILDWLLAYAIEYVCAPATSPLGQRLAVLASGLGIPTLHAMAELPR